MIIPLFLFGCIPSKTTTTSEANEELSGGAATVFDTSDKAFSLSIRGLSRSERRAFAVGNAFFNDNWITAPASADGRDGLGPLFNAHSCSSCHFKDGRAQPPTPEIPHLGFLLRLRTGTDGHPKPDPNYGDQIQDQSIPGVESEAKVAISYQPVEGMFRDGTVYSLQKPTYSLSEMKYGELSSDTVLSPRIAPGVFGNGLLEAISSDTIRNLADPNDENGDGISGKANVIDNKIGRFGWKADVPSIREQTAGAFLGDIGITSPPNPEHIFPSSQTSLFDIPTGGEPELSEGKLQRIVQYVQLLAVPARRGADTPSVKRGKKIFRNIQCASCHTPTIKTGDEHPIESLRNQTIHPYSDLLLHDMGDELADGFHSHLATGNEWRTPPLWGLGLQETVNGHTRLLHDGRARNVTEAILWHGGEAKASREHFRALSHKKRTDLLNFLQSL
ncbi:MAG: di-heme oxidoredictase family protein [Myxococcota bacterium]|nr:di-heme oxidoredictase family protein [Myxococcota bacterium]